MLPRNRKAIIALGFALILMCSACAEKRDAEILPESGLRILTHNVWFGFTRVLDRKTQWLHWMKAQHADIIFLQELNEYTPEQLEHDAAQ